MTDVTILDARNCHLGEGPSYDADTDTLMWLDIVGKRLELLHLATSDRRHVDLPEMASAVAVVDAERLALVTETGLKVMDRVTGGITMHAPIEAENPATRSNDSRVHPSGAFWIGTMAKDATRGAGAIYWHRGGKVRLLYPGISIPNSICFSPDGRVGYFADSLFNCLMRVDLDPATGLPVGEAKVLVDTTGHKGVLDGSVTDADGVIWNARWGGRRLDAWSPQGELLKSLPLPTRQPTCPVFIGPKLDRIAVTSAWQDMDEATRARDELAGRILTPAISVRGKAEPRAIV